MDIDLEKDIKSDDEIIAACADVNTAVDFYSALCNIRWRKPDNRPDDIRVVDALRGNDPPFTWSCSWRYAGGIIADIRNTHYNTNETYMDFYCSGAESHVTKYVEMCFNRLGWIKVDRD